MTFGLTLWLQLGDGHLNQISTLPAKNTNYMLDIARYALSAMSKREVNFQERS